MTAIDEIKSIEKKIWFDPTHIILALGLAAALFVGVYLFESKQVSIAEGKAAVATAVAAQAKEDAKASDAQNKQLQAQKDAVIAQLQAANQSLTDANTKLADAMKAEAAALANQKSVDRTMPPTQQAARWATLVPGAQVAPTPTGFAVDANGGLNTILQLEELPVVTKQLAQATQQLDNDKQVISNDALVLKAEQDKHASDVTNDGKQLVAAQDETKKVQADFTAYKKKSRRNILRAYVAGVVSGVVLRKVLGF